MLSLCIYALVRSYSPSEENVREEACHRNMCISRYPYCYIGSCIKDKVIALDYLAPHYPVLSSHLVFS